MKNKPNPARLRIAAVMGMLAGIILLASCSTILPQLLVDRPATRTAEVLLLAAIHTETRQAEELQEQTEGARNAEQTATQVEQNRLATATADAIRTAHARATAEAAATATRAAELSATQQASGMFDALQGYLKEGYIPSISGTYYRLDDYEQNLAIRSGLVARRTGFSPKVFVVRGDVEYEVAGKNANWFITGCGFLYWDNGQENYYSVMAALDGYVYARIFLRGNQYNLGTVFYGVPERPQGNYTTTLIVNQERSYFFIDEEMVKKTEKIETSQTDGALSYMLASGSEQDFGTRCKFSNVELWVIEE